MTIAVTEPIKQFIIKKYWVDNNDLKLGTCENTDIKLKSEEVATFYEKEDAEMFASNKNSSLAQAKIIGVIFIMIGIRDED